MKYSVLIKPEAEVDIKAAVDWYENESIGLGNEFLNKLSKAIDVVTSNPYLFAIRYRTVRTMYLSKFPFGLHYLVEDNQIIVLAVLHTKLKPKS